MRHGKKLMLQTALVALILLLTVGLAVAWLINYKTNQLSAPNISISGNEFLQISTDGKNWDNTLDFTAVQLGRDITGDGIKLWRPPLNTNGTSAGTGAEIVDAAWEEAKPITLGAESATDTQAEDTTDDTAAGDYIEIPLHFRSGAPVQVYLGAASYVQPYQPEGTLLLATNGINADKVVNPSSYSTNSCTFSRNYIAGAVRVAVAEKTSTGEEERKFVWIPNRDYQLISDPSYSFAVGDNAARETSYTYCTPDKTDENSYTTHKWGEADIRESFTTKLDGTDAQAEDLVVTLTPAPDETNVYTAEIVIRIWVEGTDRESRLALAGGEFNTNLQFIAIETTSTQN